jgi:hypothetical protein
MVVQNVVQKSKGERHIRKWLNEHQIQFEEQKTFTGCVFVKRLRFDFYLNKFNACVEFDGAQHKNGWNAANNSKMYIQQCDTIKEEFCKLNNIPLVRINTIEEINHTLSCLTGAH